MCTYRLNIAVVGSLFLLPNLVCAQVVTDGTTGEGKALTGPDYEIGAGLGTEAGDNLFHSFDQFSIETGGSATFSGPGNIENIISRVTGGEISDIDGLLASSIPGASLFLFNPAGVVFGPNASLDVTGSFHVSTADELSLADGSRFSAVNTEANGFSVAAPESFGFLGADPAGITISGSELAVGEGETLSVVGGDIDIDGATLAVEGGQLNLLAADGAAEANVVTGELAGAGEGDVSIGGGAVIASIGDGGGTIRIEGGAFVVDEASSVGSINDGAADGDVGVSINTASTEVSGGSVLVTSSQGDGRGGDLDVNSEQIEITGGSLVETNTRASGRAGDTNLKSETLQVADGSRIFSTTLASGEGGDVNIQSETVTFEDGGSAETVAQADGDGGGINIVADELTVTGTSLIGSGSDGSGNGGSIDISGEKVTFQDDGFTVTTAEDAGDGGTISIAADDLTLLNGSIVTNVSETGLGEGGDIIIAADSIEVLAEGPNGGNLVSTSTSGQGDAGDIDIRAESLLADGNNQAVGAAISGSVDNLNSSAGQVRLNIGQITLLKGALISGDLSGGSAEIPQHRSRR